MPIDLKTRNAIAQLIVDMNVGEYKPIRKPEMIPLIREVNETAIIDNAIMFMNTNGVVSGIKKYRLTAIEKRLSPLNK